MTLFLFIFEWFHKSHFSMLILKFLKNRNFLFGNFKIKGKKIKKKKNFQKTFFSRNHTFSLWIAVLAMLAVKRQWRKMKFSCEDRSKFEIFRYMRVIYLKRKLRTCTIQIQKEKSIIFWKKIGYWKFSIFFPKGGPFDVKIVENFFFRFSKVLETKPKKDFHGTIQT